MSVERAPGGTSLIDVLDRVLDKGIVIDAWARVSLVGIDLITLEARVVVASIDTYLRYSDAVSGIEPVARRYVDSPRNIERPPDDDDDDDDGGSTPAAAGGGAPSFAGPAELFPRKPPARHRRPID
jgi:hypothetical protein